MGEKRDRLIKRQVDREQINGLPTLLFFLFLTLVFHPFLSILNPASLPWLPSSYYLLPTIPSIPHRLFCPPLSPFSHFSFPLTLCPSPPHAHPSVILFFLFISPQSLGQYSSHSLLVLLPLPLSILYPLSSFFLAPFTYRPFIISLLSSCSLSATLFFHLLPSLVSASFSPYILLNIFPLHSFPITLFSLRIPP